MGGEADRGGQGGEADGWMGGEADRRVQLQGGEADGKGWIDRWKEGCKIGGADGQKGGGALGQ